MTIVVAVFATTVLSIEWIRFDFRALQEWMDNATIDQAIAAALRLVGIAVGWCVALGTTLSLVASTSHVPFAPRLRRWFTLPATRRTLEGAMAMAAACAWMAVPAVATSNPADSPGVMADLPPETMSTSRLRSDSSSHVVRSGDSLWSISVARIGEALGRIPSLDEADPYWRAVVQLNLPELPSGNADLIHPGEVIRLPVPDRF